MKLKKIAAGMVLAGLVASGAAQAALVDRGGGMLYDTVLNITWLQDANYAKTSGYDADGRMTWGSAKTWADNLVFGGYSDWRLPLYSAVLGAGLWSLPPSYDGTTDIGFNITSPRSELAYMFYVNLGLEGARSPAGVYQPNYGVLGDGSAGGQGTVGPVGNLQSSIYWSGTAVDINQPGCTIAFDTSEGFQSCYAQDAFFYAWAVRPGDVGATPHAVPEPMAAALLGLGLAGLAVVRRRKS